MNLCAQIREDLKKKLPTEFISDKEYAITLKGWELMYVWSLINEKEESI